MKEMAAGMIHIGLFDGIGGFGMAAAWCGIETVVSCEIGAFALRRVGLPVPRRLSS